MMRGSDVSSRLLAAFLFLGIVAGAARAADEADPNGKWKFTLDFPDVGQGALKLDLTLDLKAEGEKLTGKIGNDEGNIDILEGTFKDQEVFFKVVDPQGYKSQYKGKVAGDTIKGTFEVEIGGPEPIRLDWNVTRVKEKN